MFIINNDEMDVIEEALRHYMSHLDDIKDAYNKGECSLEGVESDQTVIAELIFRINKYRYTAKG